MVLIVQYIAIYAPWIYALCGLVALYHIYKTWQVRAERRQALFTLEREKALRDLFNIFFVSLLLLVVMGITYFSSEVLARAIERDETVRPLATPTRIVIDIPPTPLSDASLPEATATLTVTVDIPTVVPTEAAQEIIPDTPTPAVAEAPPQAIAPSACPEPGVQLTSPANGATVSDQVDLLGTATHGQFQYYKLEYAPGANAQGGFVYLAGGNAAVSGGLLERFDSTSLANGAWTLRLVVVDITGNFPPPCAVTVNIQN